MSNWFDVDKSGLAKVQAEKEKFFVVQELVSNAFDENIKLCEINFHRIDFGGLCFHILYLCIPTQKFHLRQYLSKLDPGSDRLSQHPHQNSQL